MLETLCLVRQVGDGSSPRWVLAARETAGKRQPSSLCGKSFSQSRLTNALVANLIQFLSVSACSAQEKGEVWKSFLSVTKWFYWSLKWLWIYSFRMHIINVTFFIEINSECSLSSNGTCVKCSPFQALAVQAGCNKCTSYWTDNTRERSDADH